MTYPSSSSANSLSPQRLQDSGATNAPCGCPDDSQATLERAAMTRDSVTSNASSDTDRRHEVQDGLIEGLDSAGCPDAPASISELFVRHHLRCTKQRVALYQALMASKIHPTADQLFHQVSTTFPGVRGMSLATVYNTLEAFCKVGLAQKLPCPGGPARYDASTDNHLHLRCQESGEIHDLPESLGDRLIRALPKDVLAQVERELGFHIADVRIELVGKFDTRNS